MMTMKKNNNKQHLSFTTAQSYVTCAHSLSNETKQLNKKGKRITLECICLGLSFLFSDKCSQANNFTEF